MVSGIVTLTASATDNVGVSKLEHRVDGALIAVFAAPSGNLSRFT
jgi:hypothetical protein